MARIEDARNVWLATVRPDGRPHIAPIWFDMEGDTLVFTTWHTTVKAHNLRHDARICLCVDDEKPPFAYVIFEGTAEISSPIPEEFLQWTKRIAGRYMGQTLADSYGKRNAVEGELLIRVTPTKIIAKTGIAD